MLQLCVSQNISNTPYLFKTTGIRVYSIEEALYHAYHYWRESIDELVTDGLTAWVESLGLSQITAKMKALAALTPLSKRLLAFLNITEYFSESELASLKTDLERWEHRVEWEKLKDRADHLVYRGEPAKAMPLYRRALAFEENPTLLNNMAIACMQLGSHQEAVRLLAKAHAAQPESAAISLHYAEALILCGDYENAKTALEKASAPNTDDHVQYLKGLMAYQQEDYPLALDCFQKAAALNPEAVIYTHKLAETYQQMRQYDKAIANLEQSPTAPHHIKMAEIYAAYGHSHMPQAISHIRQAISQGSRNAPALWTKLAEYYRKDYDNNRASEAIANALPSKNIATLLENARIKKGLGRTREYQAGLREAVKGLAEGYREGGL